MKERLFITKAKEEVSLQEFIRKHFVNAKIGGIEIQKTPIMTRIVLHTTTPGLVIGSGGEKISKITELLKMQYKIDNPQIDVQKIENPNLDAGIIAKSIASQIEAGVNYKRLGNFFLEKIMRSGAVGCEIIITGKVSGERSRRERFVAGYLKKCGEPAEKEVIKGFCVANPKLGNIGVTVSIMVTAPVSIHKSLARLIEAGEKAKAEADEAAKDAVKEKKETVTAEGIEETKEVAGDDINGDDKKRQA